MYKGTFDFQQKASLKYTISTCLVKSGTKLHIVASVKFKGHTELEHEARLECSASSGAGPVLRSSLYG